jgi:hypothetical protein
VQLSAVLEGKPLSESLFTTVDANLSGDEIKSDSSGKVTFRPQAPGVYCVYISHVNSTAGEHAGKPYDEIREFATLSFTWPLEPTGADELAVKMFEAATAARASWPNFPGFTAKITGDVDDRPLDGTLTVAADGSVKLKLSGRETNKWAQAQLESITMHRAADSQPDSERTRPVLRFADDHEDHPLGRLLTFDGGQFASSYRVKDRQIFSVNRQFGKQLMSITVLDNVQNAEGKFLPHCYTVHYWNSATGELERSEAVQDTWIRVGSFDLPKEHTVSTSSASGFSVRTFKLTDHVLLSGK